MLARVLPNVQRWLLDRSLYPNRPLTGEWQANAEIRGSSHAWSSRHDVLSDGLPFESRIRAGGADAGCPFFGRRSDQRVAHDTPAPVKTSQDASNISHARSPRHRVHQVLAVVAEGMGVTWLRPIDSDSPSCHSRTVTACRGSHLEGALRGSRADYGALGTYRGTYPSFRIADDALGMTQRPLLH